MERNPKILVVDDDPRLRDLLRRYLGENGFQVFVSENGAAMSRLWVREHFDALILDLMMPGEDGLQILRRLRAAKDMTPVIMLTARGEDVDRIVGLELGADDYIAKPFRARELLSRIKSVLRRTSGSSATLHLGDVEVDPTAAVVRKAGREVQLTALEYRLLLLFAQSQGRLVTREHVRNAIWDSAGEYVSDNTLNVYVKRLRDKIEDDPADPKLVLTMRGLGYKAGPVEEGGAR